MNRKRVGLVVGATVAVVAAGAVVWTLTSGGGGGGGVAAVPSPITSPTPGAATPTSGPGVTTAPPPPGTTGRPAPTSGPLAGKSAGGAQADAAAGFMTELGAIDPGFLGDRDRMLQAGQATCADLKAHKDRDALVHDTVQRFKTAGVAVTETKASLIVDAAHNHLCPR